MKYVLNWHFYGGGGAFYVIVSLSLHKHTFDMIVFDFVKRVEGGSGGPPPEKIRFKWCKIVQS